MYAASEVEAVEYNSIELKNKVLIYNGSVLKNSEISGALYTLRIQYQYIQIQCEDGARDARVL